MEQHQLHYATVSQAIETLRKQGYTTDFNLEENCLVCSTGKLIQTNHFNCPETHFDKAFVPAKFK